MKKMVLSKELYKGKKIVVRICMIKLIENREHWLTKIGSKKSIIEKMVKSDERVINKLEFNSF